MDVSLVVFDKAAFALSRKLLEEVKAFIDENYVDICEGARSRNLLYYDIFEINNVLYEYDQSILGGSTRD